MMQSGYTNILSQLIKELCSIYIYNLKFYMKLKAELVKSIELLPDNVIK